MIMAGCMRASGKTIRGMEEGMRFLPTAISTMATTTMEELMGRVCTSGKTVRFTMESGLWVSSKAMESGKELKESHT